MRPYDLAARWPDSPAPSGPCFLGNQTIQGLTTFVSATEIISELPKLTHAERRQIARRLGYNRRTYSRVIQRLIVFLQSLLKRRRESDGSGSGFKEGLADLVPPKSNPTSKRPALEG